MTSELIDPVVNHRYILRGLTLKGKNRINEHGDTWVAISELGGNTLFKSTKDDYLKWLSPDLEVVKEV